MIVKVKKLNPNAVINNYAKPGDAGIDLTAVSKTYEGMNPVYGTGLAFEIPEGYVGLVFPRSSVCKQDLILSNCVGVIDSGYRGEVMLKFKATEHSMTREYAIGDRIGQIIIMPYPQVTLVEADELSETERGAGGYGSSGK